MNLFVVNKPWLFSLLWCAGVDSVTTNDCQLLQQMRYPVWIIVRALGLSPHPFLPTALLLLNPGPLFLTYPAARHRPPPPTGAFSSSRSPLKPT